VTNTNPKYEVGNIPTPHYGFIDIPGSNPCPQSPEKAYNKDSQKNNRKGKTHFPRCAGFVENGPGYVFGYIRSGFVSGYQAFSDH
jgi:hypothetical protein